MTAPTRAPEPATYGKGIARYMPTWKWCAATVVGLGAVTSAWADAGHWTHGLTKIAIGLAVQRLVAYITPNTKEAT